MQLLLRPLRSDLVVRHQTSDLGIAGSSPVTVDTFYLLSYAPPLGSELVLIWGLQV